MMPMGRIIQEEDRDHDSLDGGFGGRTAQGFMDGPGNFGEFGGAPGRPGNGGYNMGGGFPGQGGRGNGGYGMLGMSPNMGMDQFGGDFGGGQPPPPSMGQKGGGGGGKGKARSKRGDEQGPMRILSELSPQMGGMGPPGGMLPTGMPLSSSQAFPMSEHNAIPPPGWSNVTTIMMRNLPNKYTQRMLLTEVNQVGFLGTFDFLYLPIDPETSANRGYSFLNFIDPSFAWMFKMSYEGRKMNRFNSSKVVSVMPATLQGFDANYTHYSTARVNRGDPAARPLFLREPSQQAMSKGGGGRDNFAKRSGGGGGGGRPQESRRGKGDARPDQNPMTAVPEAMGNPWKQEEDFGGAPRAAVGGDDASGGGDDRPLLPRFCPHCGGPIQGHFQFCPHCGSSVDFTGAGAR